MEIQTDYESEATLALLRSPEATDAAIQRLRGAGIPPDAIHRAHAPPATYRCIDASGDEEMTWVIRGSAVGLPVGAIVWLGVGGLTGIVASTGLGALAALGAVMGGIVGGALGAAVGAHYDDDLVKTIDLRDVTTAEVLSVETHSHRATVHVRRALRRAGALGLLDPTLFHAPST